MANQVKDIAHLRKLIGEGVHRYHVRLNHGVRASKYMWEEADGEIWVENDVDGSECPLSDTYLYDAMRKGALYYD